jgi:hypothetical protein
MGNDDRATPQLGAIAELTGQREARDHEATERVWVARGDHGHLTIYEQQFD